MPTPQQHSHHPHAALLIDFDNVTMGIRSDLSKELKNLLSSDIIKGKVAVQRAYADWRRYPQYIVPLAESSVDLIFAPAYGSSKKNATDIRLAIDALELVFTRPEIGSFILLSGDSDFSSLVLKLKEYGKYVIGVGIRESASDLLVQNCDEYYSYSALTGLTRAGDEPRGSVASQDPWELVEAAVNQMAENNDVMRSDRLKQVMLEMDPTFDEKALGFQKFNRFMQDAAGRGMVSLKKLENGQFEIGPAAPGARADAEEDDEQRGNGQRARRSRRGGRGRGRDRDRAQHELPSMHEDSPPLDDGAEDTVDTVGAIDTAAAPASAETMADTDAPEVHAFDDAPAAAPDTLNADEIVAEAAAADVDVQADAAMTSGADASAQTRSRRGRGRGRGGRSTGEPNPIATGAELPPLETAARDRGDVSLLKAGYTLLRQATKDVLARGGSSARDSDVKRRMLEIQSDWDEHPLGFSKFSRFLRQAHDAEAINLHKTDTGYDLTIGDGGGASVKDPSHRTGKTGRTVTEQVEAPMGSQVTHAATHVAAESAPAASTPQAAAPQSSTPAPAAPASMGMRRGSRGRPAGGPPPLLAGQGVPFGGSQGTSPVVSQPSEAAPAESAPAEAVAVTPSHTPEVDEPRAAQRRERAPEKRPAKAAPAAKPAAAPASIGKFAALGFPTSAAAIATYLSEYKGVGPKSIQSLIDTFGATNVFDALQNKPDRVREVVTGARGETLLDAWVDDYTLRKAQSTPPEAQKPKPAAPGKRPTGKGPAGRGGASSGRGGAPAGRGGAAKGGRGGRDSGRKPTKRA